MDGLTQLFSMASMDQYVHTTLRIQINDYSVHTVCAECWYYYFKDC